MKIYKRFTLKLIMKTNWTRHWEESKSSVWESRVWKFGTFAMIRGYRNLLKKVNLRNPKILELGAGAGINSLTIAKILEAKIITNDYNLNKVAAIQGVSVLNMNELANSLKPVVLPGERLEVKIMKEGTEYNQGVGYLDDGTMIVVDNARHLIGKKLMATVTSVLQTTAGKMIFARAEDNIRNNNKGR